MANAAPQATGDEPAGNVTGRIAGELRQLRNAVFHIECAVGGLLLTDCNVGAGQHHDLQAHDTLGQSLEGLAEFLDSTAAQMRPEWQFDPAAAASALKLRDLAARLAKPGGQTPEPPPTSQEDCLFF